MLTYYTKLQRCVITHDYFITNETVHHSRKEKTPFIKFPLLYFPYVKSENL